MSAPEADPTAPARACMVERQLTTRGIRDRRVLEAMAAIPRHELVPEASRDRAYGDHAMSIGSGQTISQPYMVAVMTELLLGPRPGRLGRVLEVGGGSGYQAAVLSRVAERVFTVERVAALAERARRDLARLGYGDVEVVVGDGTLGLPAEAPFDGILVAAAAPSVPGALKAQLALGGRLVVPVGTRGLQELVVVQRTSRGFHEERGDRCVFVPLIGAEGWSE